MVCFLTKNGDTAIIRLICGEQSRMNASINGGDFINLDSAVNDANNDDNIKHIGALITYCGDEDKITSKLRGIQVNQQNNNNNNNNNQNTDKSSKKKTVEKNPDDWKCEECGENDCLKDKHGVKYPCLSCLQIDIGQKILRQFADKVSTTLNMNNDIIRSFMNYLKKGKEND